MNNTPENHLFTKHNILTDYKITYKIPQDKINKLRSELEKKYKTNRTINKKINEYIQSQFKKIPSLEIPGLISNNKEKPSKPTPSKTNSSKSKDENLFIKDFNGFSAEDQTSILELTKFIVNKIKTKNLSSLALFFIFQLVYNELKIKQSTFDNIINRYKNHKKSLDDNEPTSD